MAYRHAADQFFAWCDHQLVQLADDARRMIPRRTKGPGFQVRIGRHIFQATGITAYLDAGGTLENAQITAAHGSPRATKHYGRIGVEVIRDEVDRSSI
jgi:hypothetical protein